MKTTTRLSPSLPGCFPVPVHTILALFGDRLLCADNERVICRCSTLGSTLEIPGVHTYYDGGWRLETFTTRGLFFVAKRSWRQSWLGQRNPGVARSQPGYLLGFSWETLRALLSQLASELGIPLRLDTTTVETTPGLYHHE